MKRVNATAPGRPRFQHWLLQSVRAPILAILLVIEATLLGCTAPGAKEASSAIQGQPSEPVKTNPTPTATTSNAQAVDPETLLRGLASNSMLRLSNQLAESPKTFHFALRLSQPIANGQGEMVGESTTVMYVGCTNGRVSILCLTKEGLPYAFVKDHMLIAVDGGSPGGLVMFDHGAPVVRLKSKSGDAGFDFDVFYHSRLDRGEVTLDLCSIVAGLINSMQRAHFDVSGQTIAVESPISTTSIKLSDNKQAIPIREFVSRGRRIDSLFRIFDIGIDSSPPFDSSACTDLAVRSLGLPISVTDDPTADNMDFMDAPDFAGKPQEREAAVRLAGLIHLHLTGD